MPLRHARPPGVGGAPSMSGKVAMIRPQVAHNLHAHPAATRRYAWRLACSSVAPVTARWNAMSQPSIGSKVASGRATVAVVACGLFSMDSSSSRLTMRWFTNRATRPSTWNVTTMLAKTAIWVPMVSCRPDSLSEGAALSRSHMIRGASKPLGRTASMLRAGGALGVAARAWRQPGARAVPHCQRIWRAVGRGRACTQLMPGNAPAIVSATALSTPFML